MERVRFQEVQRFAPWVQAVVLVPVAVLGLLAVLMRLGEPGTAAGAPVFGALAMFFVVLATPVFVLRLETRLGHGRLRLRIVPLWMPVPFVPPRTKDIPLDVISSWGVRTYRPLSDREYWGTHFWGLGRAFGGGRYLYMMATGPFSGRGVQLRLRSGEQLLVGSKRPEDLADAIARAKDENR